MAIVSSFGAMQALTTTRNQSWWTPSEVGGSVSLGPSAMATYGAIYESQPNVRICVEFLARNIAQLDLHAFRRLGDTDRERLSDHQIEQWLDSPNPAKCEFRLMEDLISDLGIYYTALWIKLRVSRDRVGLLRLPPEQLSVHGGLLPSEIVWTLEDGTERSYSPADVVMFNGYNPSNPLIGLSPMETLRQTLAEVHAAMTFRQDFWRNGSRWEGVIERPKDAPKWTKLQQQEFRESMAAFRHGGAKSGSAPVLEDGMQFKVVSGDAQKAEYIGGLKLAREVCAAAFHIPLPLVGILEHATFSNIKEQHKHLYQDCLGPWLKMIQQEIKRQLLPECRDQDRIYLEYNIEEKMRGSFEEQSTALNVAVGRPWMTPNEARAKQNMPRSTDPAADDLAAQPGTGDSNQGHQEEAIVEGAVVDEAAQALAVRLAALEARPIIVNIETPPVLARTSMRRTFARDADNGLIASFTDSPIEEGE